MKHAPCRVGLVLVPGFSHLGLALVTEPMFIANWLSRATLFTWKTLSADGLAVASSSGLSLPVDSPLTADTSVDIALVVASFDSRAAATDMRIGQWLKRAARTGVATGGVETGSEILAAAGLLDGVEVPIHWYNIDGVQERIPKLLVSRRLYAIHGRRPLSAGGMATLDMMLDLIVRECGRDLAMDVAHHLLWPASRTGLQPGLALSAVEEAPGSARPTDPVVAVRDLMERTLEEAPALQDLARQVGCSLRHLQRLVRLRLGKSLRDLREDVRMAAAHQRVQQTDLLLTEIAVACGFASLSVFSRTYRRRFGISPSRDRHQSVESMVFRPSAPRRP